MLKVFVFITQLDEEYKRLNCSDLP